MLDLIAKILGWLWGNRWRLTEMTDEHLREIARAVIGDGSKPFSVVLSNARAAVAMLGMPITDELDARIVDAIDNALAVIRMPGALDNLARDAERVKESFYTHSVPDEVPRADYDVEEIKDKE